VGRPAGVPGRKQLELNEFRPEKGVRMAPEGEWVVVVPFMPIAEARRAFEEWKREHPGSAGLADEDIRIHMGRAVPRDEQRYLVRAETLARLVEGH
jgi:hypothetical protein